MSSANTAAQQSLMLLEQQFIQYSIEEQQEIESLRQILRELVQKYDSSAQLAILAVGFEIAIQRNQ